jgi:hypothetical protein
MPEKLFPITIFHQGHFTVDTLSRALGTHPSKTIKELNEAGVKDLLSKGPLNNRAQQISQEDFKKHLIKHGFTPTFHKEVPMGMD